MWQPQQYPLIAVRICAVFLCLVVTACQTQPQRITAGDAAQIDRLLRLVDARLAAAPLVAKAKWNSGKPEVNDPNREMRILDSVSRQAVTAGVDAAFAAAFFKAQFAANKLLQRRLHEQWRREARPAFTSVPDLAAEVRPLLDRLTPQILAALRGFPQIATSLEVQAYIRQRAPQLVRGDFNGEPRDLAIGPLLATARSFPY